MKRKILTAAMIAPMLAAPVYAGNRECYVPMKDWQSRTDVVQFVEAKGWTVVRVRIDDGCYEVFVTDADGVDFELRMDPRNLEILSSEVETFTQSEAAKSPD